MTIPRTAFFVSVREAAHTLGVSESQLYRLIKAGRIPFYKLPSRMLRVDLRELRNYMRLTTRGPWAEGRKGLPATRVIERIDRGNPRITMLVYKDRRRTFRFVHERSEPNLLTVVLRLALVLPWLLSWLKLLK